MTRSALGPTVAGVWYPADPHALADEVDALLQRATPPSIPRPIALIAPHAGFVYSGEVAASGFGLLAPDAFSRVLLIGPSHYAAFRGAALPRASTYRTPLGEIAIDRDSLEAIETTDAIGERATLSFDDGPFEREHSLEAEIPFLQRRLAPGWRLLPILLGSGSRGELAREIAEALSSVIDERTLIVASSDFTHFGPRFDFVPFEDDLPLRLRELDMGAIEPILDADPAAFREYVDRTGATVCGRDAIEVLLHLTGPGRRGRLLRYDTSGRITDRWDHSVSYASIAFEERCPS